MKIIYAESEVVTLVLENGQRAVFRLEALIEEECDEHDRTNKDLIQASLNFKIWKQIQDILGCGVVAVEKNNGRIFKLSDSECFDA